MKRIDNYLKEKFLFTEKNNIFKKLYFMYHKFFMSHKKIKKSYSHGGIDLLLNHLYKDQSKGVYVDIGCHHPINGNNTYLLHKKGWTGINIDLDPFNIEIFNYFRPKDFNKSIAISNKEGMIDLYFYHDRSAINTTNKSVYNSREKKAKVIKKIPTTTLDSIIEVSPYKDKKLNLVSIDVEGSELEVLQGFDLKKYYPEVVIIEFLDLEMKKLEFFNQSINKIIGTELYTHMIKNNYNLVNWVHSDLVFVNNDIRN